MGRAILALAFAHRWLGIACGFLFVLWFVSGIVMLYARMPALDPVERLSRLPPLDLASARVDPATAARHAELEPDRLRVGMLLERPVYRFVEAGLWSTVFADDGTPMLGLGDEAALRVAREYEPACEPGARHDGFLQVPDQWTLQLRPLLPLHRVVCGDRAATVIYVSDRTGEVALRTDRRGRAWGYLGPVTHWVYFTPLRRNGELWLRSLTVASLVGCLLTLSGLAAGIARFSPRRRARRRGLPARSPYAGLMRWHHYAGLAFGLVTFGWILSGGLSLDPFDWHSSTAASRAQREGVAGGPLRLAALDLELLRGAASVIETTFRAKELEAIQLDGLAFVLAHRPPPRADRRRRPRKVDQEPADFLAPVLPLEALLVPLDEQHEPRRAIASLDQATVLEAARRAMPQARLVDAELLESYDPYYYDRSGDLPLPVLRARYDDLDGTWLYLDPARGLIVRREERSSRADRWVYRALHRWDFPWLHARRPLWDVVVILLLLGGLTLSVTTAMPAARRLGRHAARLRRRSGSHRR